MLVGYRHRCSAAPAWQYRPTLAARRRVNRPTRLAVHSRESSPETFSRSHFPHSCFAALTLRDGPKCQKPRHPTQNPDFRHLAVVDCCHGQRKCLWGADLLAESAEVQSVPPAAATNGCCSRECQTNGCWNSSPLRRGPCRPGTHS